MDLALTLTGCNRLDNSFGGKKSQPRILLCLDAPPVSHLVNQSQPEIQGAELQEHRPTKKNKIKKSLACQTHTELIIFL